MLCNSNQLVGFADGETTASYAYNVNGLRVEKVVDGQRTNHVWDGSQQIVADVIDSLYYEAQCYIRGTSLAATYRYQNAVKSDYTYYVQNAHGDVVNLTDTNGAVTKTYRYDAFGVEFSPVTGDINVFRYCGEYFDTETGTIYLRARYYQASIGKFTQRDTVAGKIGDPLSLNLYTYAHNNPVYYWDSSGHKAAEKWLHYTEKEKNLIYDASRLIAQTISNDLTKCKKTVQTVVSYHKNGVEMIEESLSGKKGTYSIGKTDSGSLMFFSYSYSKGVSFDWHGNIALQYTHAIAMTAEVAGISRTFYSTKTTADDIYGLEGKGGAMGISGGELWNAGFDFVFGGNTIPDATNYGYSAYAHPSIV